MYFPYIHALQAERLAFQNGIDKNLTIPIIDGSQGNPKQFCIDMLGQNAQFVLLVDGEGSAIDQLRGDLSPEQQSLFDSNSIIGLRNSQLSLSDKFPPLRNKRFAIVHDGIYSAQPKWSGAAYHIFMPSMSKASSVIDAYPQDKVVLIEDAFQKAFRNADYGVEDVFSSHVFSFKGMGRAGFGDALTETVTKIDVGAANLNNITSAIHLTYAKEDVLYVRHYITSPIEEPDNNQRIRMTMNKALKDINKYESTKGLELLKEKAKSATNLAMLKRISFLHHLDLIQILLRRRIQ